MSLENIQCQFITPKDFDRVVEFAREYFLRVRKFFFFLPLFLLLILLVLLPRMSPCATR